MLKHFLRRSPFSKLKINSDRQNFQVNVIIMAKPFWFGDLWRNYLDVRMS
ncbi:hypothetical protein [Pseudanabaena minima]